LGCSSGSLRRREHFTRDGNKGFGGGTRVSADHTICRMMSLNSPRRSFDHGRVLGCLLRRLRRLGRATGRSVG
jgi:hypothetical protein